MTALKNIYVKQSECSLDLNHPPFLLPNNDFITGLQVAIKEAMGSPFSGPIHKLSALLFIAKIKGISFEIPEEILTQSLEAMENNQFLQHAFQALMAYQPLERVDALVRLAGTECNHTDKAIHSRGTTILRALSPLASPAQLSSLINDSLLRVTSNESSERQLMHWDNILPILALHVRDAHDIDKLMKVSMTRLYDSDYGIHWGARVVLIACAKDITSAQMDVLIALVTTHLHAVDEVIRERALNSVEYILAPYVTPTHIERFIVPVIGEITSPDTQVRVRMLYTLAALAPKANDTQLDAFTKTTISALTDKHSDVRNSATKTLTKLAPYLTSERMDLLMMQLISTLNPADYNTNWYVPASLPSLKMLASYATPKHVDMFITTMINGLYIPPGALDTFAALTAHATLNQRAVFIGVVENHLGDYTQYLDGDSLREIISALAAFVPVSKIDALMRDVVTRLNNAAVRELALTRLGVLATHATSEEINSLLMQVASRLNDPAWNAGRVLDILTGFLQLVAPPDALIAALTNALENSDEEISNAALCTLGACAVHTTQAQTDVLITLITPKLSDPDEYIRYLAVMSLKALANHTTPAQTETLIGLVTGKLDDPNENPNLPEGKVGSEALETLHRLIGQATPVQMKRIVNTIANKLDDIRPFFSGASLNILSALMTSNVIAREHLDEYNQTHQASTVGHGLMNLMLDLYACVYEPTILNVPISLKNI